MKTMGILQIHYCRRFLHIPNSYFKQYSIRKRRSSCASISSETESRFVGFVHTQPSGRNDGYENDAHSKYANNNCITLTSSTYPSSNINCHPSTNKHRYEQLRGFATAKQKRIAAAKAKKEREAANDAKEHDSDSSNITHDYGTPKTGLILPSSSPSSIKSSFATSLPSQQQQQDVDFISPLHDREHLQKDLNPPHQHPIQSYSSIRNYNMDTHLQSQFKSNIKPQDLLDLSSSYDPYLHLPNKPLFVEDMRKEVAEIDTLDSKLYEVPTPLGQEIMKTIGVSGEPFTVADFMKRCLRDEKYGYYTNPPKSRVATTTTTTSDSVSRGGKDDIDDVWDSLDEQDTLIEAPTTSTSVSSHEKTKGRGQNVIGTRGDFTTAPEISQLFGECITIWLLTQYEALNKPSAIQLVEIGPGRGTLICDVLRSAKAIKGVGEEFIMALVKGSQESSSPSSLHLVEVSEYLRQSQKEALQSLQEQQQQEPEQLTFDFLQWKTRKEREVEMEKLYEKVREQIGNKEKVDEEEVVQLMETLQKEQKENIATTVAFNSSNMSNGIQVQWHDSFNSIPTNSSDDNPTPIFVICQEIMDALPVHVFQKTIQGWRERMVDVVTRDDSKTIKSNNQEKLPRFRYVLSPGITPALRTLLHVNDDGNFDGDNSTALDSAPIDSVIEVCPEAMMLVQDITARIEESGGAALIVDYGNEGSGDTLRAFRKHEQVDVLHTPGNVDITADVDFEALRNAVNLGMNQIREKKAGKHDRASEDVPLAFGPVGQGAWLASMGIVERSYALIDDESTNYEQAEDICNAVERLVSEEQMGTRYKVMAIARKKDKIFPPPGFA